MANWLLVERLENWETDREEGFLRFGLPNRKRILAGEIRKGDTLIVYISSGVSRFSDVRSATEDGSVKLGFEGNYDTAFPISLSTKLQFALDKEKWVPVDGLVDKLSFTAGKGDWRQIMRNSLRRLSDADAKTIIAAMKQVGKSKSRHS